jgi:hypothetical protein
MDLKERVYESADWIRLFVDVVGDKRSGSVKGGEILDNC